MRALLVFLIAALFGVSAQAEQAMRQPPAQKESSSKAQGSTSDQREEEEKEDEDDDSDLDEVIDDMNEEGENDMFW